MPHVNLGGVKQRSSALFSLAIALVASPAVAQVPPEPPVSPELPPPLPPTPPAIAYELHPAPPEAWHSGYHNGNFYIRSSDDVFRLYVMGASTWTTTTRSGPA